MEAAKLFTSRYSLMPQPSNGLALLLAPLGNRIEMLFAAVP
jgi:hypothetical protein